MGVDGPHKTAGHLQNTPKTRLPLVAAGSQSALYGGWGEEILDKLVEPFFNRLRAEERAATGGTEWSTLAKREFLFQCTSVAIARGNMVVLSTLRQGWQQQPSANTKRGKPHHATLKAGLFCLRPGCGMSHRSWHARLPQVSRQFHNQRPAEVTNLDACMNSPALPGPCANCSSAD